MQPTGKLHLGNLVGALESWVEFQNTGYENFHMVADWHSLTVDYRNTSDIYERSLEVVIDWLSAGIDPDKSVIFLQSGVKEHAELHLLLSMLVTVPRLERNPTLKERIKDMHLDNNISYGHLGYPVLQAADILIYRANYVPVGEDQMPHIELTREIARRFNSIYGKVFPEPEGKLTPFGRLPGLDGKKMSKSLGNTVLISDSEDEIRGKIIKALTDPSKIKLGDKGNPDICVVYAYHQKFNEREIYEVRQGCKSGRLGCVECKNNLAEKLIAYLSKLRENRSYFEMHRDEVKDIISSGIKKARNEAEKTMDIVYRVMKFGAPV